MVNQQTLSAYIDKTLRLEVNSRQVSEFRNFKGDARWRFTTKGAWPGRFTKNDSSRMRHEALSTYEEK